MMQPEIAKEQLNKAEEDFGFAFVSIENTEFFSQICFHFQQSAEKYLKAYIVAAELPFRLVHSLLELVKICKNHDLSAKEIEDACHYLNPFYIDTRYPVHWPTNYDKNIAREAKAATITVKNWVMKAFDSKQLSRMTYGLVFKVFFLCPAP